MKTCPFCAEEIQDAAIKCRYCSSQLNAPPEPVTTVPDATDSPRTKPSVPSAKRYRSHNITEANASLLEDGSVIELRPGGTISEKAEQLLAEKHVTVLRSATGFDASGPAPSATASDESTQQHRSRGFLGFWGLVLAIGVVLLVIAVNFDPITPPMQKVLDHPELQNQPSVSGSETSSAEFADNTLRREKANGDEVTQSALALVQRDHPAQAKALYDKRRDYLKALIASAESDTTNMNDHDRQRVLTALRADLDSVSGVIAKYNSIYR